MKNPDIRVKRITALALSMFVGALCIYAFSLLAHGQDIHPRHVDQEEFENAIAFKLIEVTSYDTRLVYWKKELKMQVKLGSFAYDKYSDVQGKRTGCYYAVFCRTHDFLYFLIPCKERNE